MAAKNIFTRKRMGFDNKVWITMLVMIFLSATLVGYNYRNKDKDKHCESLPLYVNGISSTDNVTFNAGIPIRFGSYFNSNDKVVWNFGDNTQEVRTLLPVHVFKQEGTFRVTVSLNGQCGYEKIITIKNPPPVRRDTTGRIIEEIISPDKAFLGTKVTFSTELPATDYQWYVENEAYYPQLAGSSASYTFRTPGTYIIVLLLNGNTEKKIRKSIIISRSPQQEDGLVKPKILIEDALKTMKQKPVEEEAKPVTEEKPPAEVKPPPEKKYKSVANEILKTYIQAVVCGEKTSAEFEEYLCEGANTIIIENNKDRKQFKSFCEEIKGKRVEILSVEATRDNTLCATKLSVRLDRKRRWEKSPCKD